MSERVGRLTADEAKAATGEAGIPEYMADLSVFQIALRNPPVAAALNQMLVALIWKGRLDPRLRELVIMRIGWVTGAEYEWAQHYRVATGIGMTDDDIVGVRDWTGHAGYGPAERAVLAATDETLDTGVISDETWAACRAHVGGDDVLVELVVAIGNWSLFSTMLRSLRVPLEDDTPSWPPDGQRPPTA